MRYCQPVSADLCPCCPESDFLSICEYVSENKIPLPSPTGDSGGDNDGGCYEYIIGPIPFIPSGLAVAFPRLNERGLLILDGSESVGASFYRWTIRDLASGAECSTNGLLVDTESLASGLYEVTLDCTGQTRFRFIHRDANGIDIDYPPDPYYHQAVTKFNLVIPPRVNLAERQAAGAVHIRWALERINNRQAWSLYLSGHVFEGIGSSVNGFNSTNLRAWVTINGQNKDVTLDAAGRFLDRWVAGSTLVPAYDLSLTVRTLDDGREYVVDALHETNIAVFSPLLPAYRRR